jgi:hypothetical protein
MNFLKILSNLIVTGGIMLVFLFAWGLSIRAVYRSLTARQVASSEKLFWMALALALPLIGAAVYLFARLAGFLTPPPLAAPTVDRDVTEYQIQPGPKRPFSESSLAQEFSPAARQAASACQFSVIEGPCTGAVFTLDTFPARIGRGIEAHIRLEDDPQVSRRHAELYQQDGSIYLRDLGSLHGTRVNGSPAGDVSLSPGDTITVGDTVIVFARKETGKGK